jgi:squalene-hopene/tetraprenyl-beta-curcumene cyclase
MTEDGGAGPGGEDLRTPRGTGPSSMSSVPDDLRQEAAATQERLRALQSRWPAELFGDHLTHSSTYDCFPHLFRPAFPGVDLETARSLSLAGCLLANSLFVYDALVDGTAPALLTPANLLRAQALQFEAYRLLHVLLPPASPFWEDLRKHLAELAAVTLVESRLRQEGPPWPQMDLALARRLAIGKAGVAEAAIAALAALSGREGAVGPLTAALDEFAVATQMFDDLRDWKEDLAQRMPSLLLARAHDELAREGRPLSAGDRARVAKCIYYGGHASSTIEIALGCLERASEYTASLGPLPWQLVVADLRRSLQSLAADIERIVSANRTRLIRQPDLQVALPAPRNAWEHFGQEALRFVLAQWRLGFGEARHIMHLRPEVGFNIQDDYHFGDVFQRALLADGLCDAAEAFGDALHPVMDFELEYLLSRRQRTGVEGWSYFPTVPEVASDADDLGQVMQALLRRGRRPLVEQLCERPLEVLLRDRWRPDGSFETWIVPAHGRTPLQERQVQANALWGVGPDNEVMANLLFALALYDHSRFQETLLAGVRYLVSRQEADGHWESRWYYGPYYGTYVCLRLLRVTAAEPAAVDRARRFLRASQRGDGGWALAAESDQLSTALAMLGLAAAWPGTDDLAADRERAARARAFLAESYGRAGWEATPFIRPRADAPYRSRTITSLFAMKAALAWRTAEGEPAVAGRTEPRSDPVHA